MNVVIIHTELRILSKCNTISVTFIMANGINNIKENWKYPHFWSSIVVRQVGRIWSRLPYNGVSIPDEEWDNLIILDACRYDTFKKEIVNWDIKGRLESRISKGSNTPEFLMRNFGNGRFDDIVYITANPFVIKLLRGRFHRIIWDFGYDEKLGTVLPGEVYRKTLETIEKYEDKRFIIHFIQPHQPYLKLKHINRGSVHELLRRGELDKETVREAYEENLRMAMLYVERLCRELEGKIVITSDHSQMIDDKIHPLLPFRVTGHPSLRIEQLIRVPWFRVE